MRLGFDATPLLGQRTGIGRYAWSLLRELLEILPPEDRVLLYAFVFRLNPLTRISHRALDELRCRPNVEVAKNWFPASVRRWMWNSGRGVSIERLVGDLDVYHATNYLLPLTRRARTCVTVHDLGLVRLAPLYPPVIVERFRRTVEAAVARADRVITDSAFSADEISDLLQVPREDISVVHLAADPHFSVDADPERDRLLLGRRHRIAAPYFLFVGNTAPRKNVSGLLRAFQVFAERRDDPHKLVVVGNSEAARQELMERAAALGIETRVMAPAFVDDEDLPAFYRQATAFVFPSLYEGFGIPVLEAMACGCPVITSHDNSLAEVAGEAALLADPRDPEAVAAGIDRVVDDRAFADRLRVAGLRRAAEFSWSATARRTLGIYGELAGEVGRAPREAALAARV